jgi:endo-1,4-beta-mannosidase
MKIFTNKGFKKYQNNFLGKLNNDYWNGIIPQSNKDYLDKFVEYCEKEDLGVLVIKLGDKKHYAGLNFMADKFISLQKEK